MRNKKKAEQGVGGGDVSLQSEILIGTEMNKAQQMNFLFPWRPSGASSEIKFQMFPPFLLLLHLSPVPQEVFLLDALAKLSCSWVLVGSDQWEEPIRDQRMTGERSWGT